MTGVIETELLIVGAGPCGLSAGVAAKRAGLDAVLVDKGAVAGAIVGYPVNMSFFSTSDRLEIGGVPFVVERDKPSRSEALNYYRRVASHFGLDVRQYEEVVSLEPQDGRFRAETRSHVGTRRRYLADRVVIATGYCDTPNLLDVPGEELPKVKHYFDEAHRYYDQDVLVVGGGNSAVETALAVWRAGGRVRLVHLFAGFDEGVKPWVLPDIENRVEEGSIPVSWGHRVAEIAPERVRIEPVDGGEGRWLPNDWVLAMTGYRPDPALLRQLGVEPDPETGIAPHDPETMETSRPGVYIAGVLAAGYDANRIFIENGRHHGPRIVRHVLAQTGRDVPVALETHAR